MGWHLPVCLYTCPALQVIVFREKCWCIEFWEDKTISMEILLPEAVLLECWGPKKCPTNEVKQELEELFRTNRGLDFSFSIKAPESWMFWPGRWWYCPPLHLSNFPSLPPWHPVAQAGQSPGVLAPSCRGQVSNSGHVSGELSHCPMLPPLDRPDIRPTFCLG